MGQQTKILTQKNAGPKSNFDLKAALLEGGLYADSKAARAQQAILDLHAEAKAALAQATPAPSLLRGLSEGDISKLLAAIKLGPDAVNACVAELGAALGFNDEQRSTIVQLAQTLAKGQGALEQAQAAMAQAQRNQARVERELRSLQTKRGLPPTQVPSAIAAPRISAVNQPQPEWAQFPAQTVTPEGEGPKGGFGAGFSAPSLKERVAAKALAQQQAATQDAAANQQVAASPDAATPDGTTSDFLKKVDSDSKLDFSEQQKDLAQIRAGAGGFNTQVLDMSQLDEETKARQEEDKAISKVIMETIPQVRSYFKHLEQATKEIERQYSGKNLKHEANYESALSSVIAGIRKAKSDLDAGIKPSKTQNSAQSSSLPAAPSAMPEEFSLSQQTSTGFDINDPRHLGAQLVGSVSLANNESAAAPGGSFELPTTIAAQTEAAKAVPVAPVPEPVVAVTPVETQVQAELSVPAAAPASPLDILAKAQALSGELPDETVPPPVVAKAARPLSTEVNRSLQSMVSSLQEAEGHSATDLSIDDIMGSSLGEQSAAQLTPINVAGSASTQPEADLPPWDVGGTQGKKLQTPTMQLPPEKAQVSAQISLAPSQDAALMPEAAVTAKVSGHQVEPVEPVLTESSGEVKVQGLTQDKALLEPTIGKVLVDGSTDLSAEQAAVRSAVQNLASLEQVPVPQLSDAERHELQQKQASAAMDVLASFGQKLAKDIEFTQNLGPSPWEELSTVQVLTIDERDFKIKYPKIEKLARVSAHNVLAQSNAEPSAQVKVFDAPLNLNAGELWAEHGAAAIARLQQEMVSEQAEHDAAQKSQEAFNQKLKLQVAQGVVHDGPSSEFQAVLAERNASLAASLAARAASLPSPSAPSAVSAAAAVAALTPQSLPEPQVMAVPPMPQQKVAPAMAAPQSMAAPLPLAAPQDEFMPENELMPEIVPVAPQPMLEAVVPGGGAPESLAPDFGPVPDYISAADESLGESDSGSDDEDEVNDVDFGSAGADMELPAPASMSNDALVSEALAGSDLDLNFGSHKEPFGAKAFPLTTSTGEISGRRRLNQDDFLEEVAKEDSWYQLLLQVFPDKGPIYATLSGVQRLVDPNDPQHWRLGIDRNVDLSFIDPDFWRNTQKRFEQFLGTKLKIEVEALNSMPPRAPEQLALLKQQEAVFKARQDIKRVKPLQNLFKLLGENWEQVGIELFTPIEKKK